MGRSHRGRRSLNRRGEGFQHRLAIKLGQNHTGDQRHYSTLAVIAIAAGIYMVVAGDAWGDQCKMKVIDKSRLLDPSNPPGNLPHWFTYTGTVYILLGVWSFLSFGSFPAFLRSKSPMVGGCATGVFGSLPIKFLLFWLYFLGLICNCLGVLWLWLAGMVRNEGNSKKRGQQNYCDPALWISAQILTVSFWLVSLKAGLSFFTFVYMNFKDPYDNTLWATKIVMKRTKNNEEEENSA